MNLRNFIFFLFTLSSSLLVQASARDIEVKYRSDLVNVDDFTNYSLKRSSFVNEILYRKNDQYLLVKLKSTFYQYCKIPNSTVRNWIASDSLGAFYQRHIKGKFDCREKSHPV